MATAPVSGKGRSPGFWLPKVPRLALYVIGLVPAAWTFWLALSDRLGADPVKALEHTLGLWALRFLIATLCVTPLRRFSGVNLLRYRRALGLLAFYYGLLHLCTWLVLDQGLDGHAILADIVKRPYITIGMLALALMLPLALTSTNWSVRKMGGQAWARLHKLVYPAAAAAAVHFVMVVKSWPAEPLIYAAIIAALLAVRLVRTGRRGRRPSAQRA
jgi:sulfoxide reductase heme-binding subunit YedZ